MFSKNRKQFKKRFSGGKGFKGKGKRDSDQVFQTDDLSDDGRDKSDGESEKAKEVMKERMRNYKKFLIEEGKSSVPKWETFSDDEQEASTSSPEKTIPETKQKVKGKKRKSEKDELSGMKAKIAKKSKNSVDMEEIKAKLKEKYDNNKWNEIPNPEKTFQHQQRCLGCREIGHLLKDCKVIAKRNQDICMKCGSSDHKHKDCPVKGSKFNFATCFKCKQMGHISKQCPKSATGIYPNGGSCNHCQSVDHLARHCPKKSHRGGRKHRTKDSKKFYRVNKSRN